ncbi:ankyrin repeat domain-containing protein [Aspergillus mulundensis]|uniref:F-box domain-containing protein n=1 Tax=Aspergillus mulundensis TaxID=1810919 RepID=A0A3D8Q7P5_9EURO|nr:hypothetical protein DSM5745_11374 [Aspergillus mulundensis]RDW57856.1 hypothetical protein DSM5745_11374 [Aspergillus mulundensis]
MSTPTFPLFDLPEELILSVLDFSEPRDLAAFIRASHESRRIGHSALYSSCRPIMEKQKAFLWAAENNQPKLLEYLTRDILPIIKKDESFRNIALLNAARSGCCEVATLLLDNGAKPYMDPFMEAVSKDKLEVIKLFVTRGAKIEQFPNHPIDHGIYVRLGKDNILHFAAMEGAASVVEYILSSDFGLNINSVDPFNYTPLMKAVQGSHATTVAILLKHAADTEIPTAGGLTPLSYAAAQKPTGIVKQLLDAGANIHVCQGGESPLVSAVIWNAMYHPNAGSDRIADSHRAHATIRLLLDRGVDINHPRSFRHKKDTALHLAAAAGDADMVRLLLSYKPSLDVTDTLGATPLAYATRFPAVVELLLDAGASLCSADTPGTNYPLCMAVVKKHTASARLLIARRPEGIDGTDPMGRSPLALAACWNRRKLMGMLVKAGADLDKRDCVGRTPRFEFIHASSEFLGCADKKRLYPKDLYGRWKSIMEKNDIHDYTNDDSSDDE